jgi:hypothetical protein
VSDPLTRSIASTDLRTTDRSAAGADTRSEGRLATALFAAALGYATLRYNVFKGVPWADWPAYTVNKALAVASLLMIAATVIRLGRPRARTGTLMGAAGALALAHSLLSFALLNPGYYARLFDEDGKLTFVAGLSLTLGAGVMAAMELGARRSANWSLSLRQRTLALVAFLTGFHAALPAVSSWLEPAAWPGGMPPLTLISFTAGVVAVAALRLHAR